MRKNYFKVYLQIFLLVTSTIAFAYLINLGSEEIEIKKESIELGKLSLFLLKILNKIIWNEKSLVSAQSIIQTCEKTKDGRYCIEYPAAECAENCEGGCIDALSSEIEQCRLGTCYDPIEGTCAPNSIKKQCEIYGGVWLNDAYANSQQCKKGCCMIRNEPMFITERACSKISENLGMAKDFRPEADSEAKCLASAYPEEEGACILGKDSLTNKNLCRFLTKSSCISLKGEFHAGVLCSNPELNTNCQRQIRTQCLEGKDEVYWIDSCGNRENIYDSDKVKSYNNGMVLAKSESCSLSSGSNPIANQGTCGNCDYFRGSVCGNKTSNQKLIDNLQNVVCRDLSCIDENGKRWQHGESWCEYTSAIGVSSDNARSMDVPGSRHIRKACFEGEIKTEPCADGRTEICVASKTNIEEREFSISQCRINRAQLCNYYNSLEDKSKAMEDCAKSSDCFVKSIGVTSQFHFNVCVPKYPIGFDLELNGESAANLCAAATQRCTVVYVKKLGHGWKCEQNCKCETELFTNQMHDLCMSLGDCGASVNYLGKLTENYEVARAPRLSKSYLDKISKYNNTIPGKVAEPGNLDEIYDFSSSLGDAFGGVGEIKDVIASESWTEVNTYVGAIGTLFHLAGMESLGIAKAVGPVAAGMGNAVAGAAMGFAMTYYLLKVSKVTPGFPPSLTYALLGLGAAAGAAIMAGAAIGAAVPIVGWIVAGIIVSFIGVCKLVGIGKVRERIVEFRCNPWQPPRGGEDCSKCGEKVPCSKYSCQSLGVLCKFVNEGTKNEECIAVGKDDISPPLISPLQGKLKEGYEYSEVSNLGFMVKSKTGDGCIKLYTPVEFGISLNKFGKCRWDVEPNKKYEDMEFEFSSGLFKMNHSMLLNIPAPVDEELPAYEPGKRADYNMYVKCENGNVDDNGKPYASTTDFVIKFCVMPGDDYSPPAVEKGAGKVYVPYGTTSANLSIYTNEPAQCRWSSLPNKTYNLMSNNMECENNITQRTAYGWMCRGTFPIAKNTSLFYIRCEDKQWESDASKRNANSEDIVMEVIRTQKLEIISAEPNNVVISSGVEPTSVEVSLQTSGGLSDWVSCSHSLSGNYFGDYFEKVGGVYKKTFESFSAGKKKIQIKCEDIVGNIAWKNISFDIEIDKTAPRITRIYSSGGGIFVRTDEPAQCAISKESCNFDFQNGTMMLGMGTEHTATPEKNVIYYVKCRDPYGNTKGNCELKIKVL